MIIKGFFQKHITNTKLLMFNNVNGYIFFSHLEGFPLDKAVSYAKLRNPLLINDLNMQYFIQDRCGKSSSEIIFTSKRCYD